MWSRYSDMEATGTDRAFYVGLDLGQQNDYTAVAIVERVVSYQWDEGGWTPNSGLVEPRRVDKPPLYRVRHLERLRLRTPYPDVVERTNELIAVLAKREPNSQRRLIVDHTGVGVAVVDMLRDAGLEPVAVTITGGNSVTHSSDVWRVPKRDLVSVLLVLLQAERLRVASRLKEAEILVKELLNFRVKISDSGHDSYEHWRESGHDDLVLATALGCWYAEYVGASGGFSYAYID